MKTISPTLHFGDRERTCRYYVMNLLQENTSGEIAMRYSTPLSSGCLLIVLLTAVLFVSGYTGSNPSPVNSPNQMPGAAGPTITIQNFAFNPPTLSVPRGTIVTWINEDSVEHQIVSDSGTGFSSNPLPKSASYPNTVDNPGSFPYHGSIHPSMKRTVMVT